MINHASLLSGNSKQKCVNVFITNSSTSDLSRAMSMQYCTLYRCSETLLDILHITIFECGWNKLYR